MDTGNHGNDKYGEMYCDARTITECQSETIRPAGRNGPLIARIPVIISQAKVHIHVQAKLKLEQPIVSIRGCKRNVFATSCRLMDMGNKRNGKLYIEGFIKESIEYADGEYVDERECGGYIRFATFKVPFECTAKIEYYVFPVLETSDRLIPVKMLGVCGCNENGYSSSIVQSEEQYNSLYCHLDDITIKSTDIAKDQWYDHGNSFSKRGTRSIAEHLMISAKLTVMQEQLINIPLNLHYNG